MRNAETISPVRRFDATPASRPPASPVWTLPNLLTGARIAAIPVVVALILQRTSEADLAACVLFALAGVTDFLDGALARARNQVSALGRMLDSIADKLLVGAVLMSLAATGRLGGALAAGILLLLREIFVSGIREHLAGLGIGLPVSRLAKWKTTAQFAALGVLLAGPRAMHALGLPGPLLSGLGQALLWLAALLSVTSFALYLRQAVAATRR